VVLGMKDSLEKKLFAEVSHGALNRGSFSTVLVSSVSSDISVDSPTTCLVYLALKFKA